MFKEWLTVAANIQDNIDSMANLKCPNCGHHEIDYLYVGDKTEKVGYLQAWCNHCHRGIHISRVQIPENVKMKSFGDIEEINKIIPSFKPVTPEE